jgi:uncharacterized protein (TIGR02246 family)
MEEIEAVAQRYVDAVRDKDEQGFLSLYDEQVTVFDLWDQWSYVGRDAWAASVAAWFGSLGDEQVQVAFRPVSCVVEGRSAAWSAIVSYSGLSAAGEVLRSMENRISWFLRRSDTGWIIVHEHTSAPADHETLAVALKR